MTRNARHTNGAHILDGVPQTLVHGAEEGATKIAEAVESASTRVAKGAGHAGEMASGLSGQIRQRMTQSRPRADALLKAQLARTSHELADESSALNAAVASLNGVIKANRRAAARGRTRLFGGLALGAALMYHLDRDHGRERRAATARLVTSMWRGGGGPTSPLS